MYFKGSPSYKILLRTYPKIIKSWHGTNFKFVLRIDSNGSHIIIWDHGSVIRAGTLKDFTIFRDRLLILLKATELYGQTRVKTILYDFPGISRIDTYRYDYPRIISRVNAELETALFYYPSPGMCMNFREIIDKLVTAIYESESYIFELEKNAKAVSSIDLTLAA